MSLSDFISSLVVFGPLTAVSLFVSGLLLPGALACAIFSIWKQRSNKQIWAFGAICMATTSLFLNNFGEYWILNFLSTFIIGAMPLLIQTIALIWLLRFVKKKIDAPDPYQKMKVENAEN